MKHGVKRRERLLRYLGEHSFAKVPELARRLRCSERTIQRDLERLEHDAMVLREDGGATFLGQVKIDYHMSLWAKKFWREKVAIGRAAVGLIKPGERVFIGTGATALAMASELTSYEGITVLPTSLAVVAALLWGGGIECILLGGRVYAGTTDLYGPELEEQLSRIHVDCAFIGADAISSDGVLSAIHPCIQHANRLVIGRLNSHVVGRVNHLVMKCADRVVLLMDSSKACEETVHRRLGWVRQRLTDLSNGPEDVISPFANLEDVDCLITDSHVPIGILEVAHKAGVRTIVVKV